MLVEIPIADIVPNPHQPRVHFDEETLGELAASIAQIGVLQPVLVRPVDDGYQLIAGERRWRAAQRAGPDDGAGRRAHLRRRQRRRAGAGREPPPPGPHAARGGGRLPAADRGLRADPRGGRPRVGKSRSAITNTLRLLGLPPAVQHLLADGKLSAGHARALLGTPDRALQEQLARQAVDRGVVGADRRGGGAPRRRAAGADAARRRPAERRSTGPGSPRRPALRPPGLLELEELLADHLDTRVGVQMGAKRGKVTIEFADLEDLERIYRLIVGDG